MKFEAAHVALLDAEGIYEVRCQGAEQSDCWQYEDENGEMVMGTECQIALWLNNSSAPAVHGRIMVPLEIEAWDEDGVEASMVGQPTIIRVVGGHEYTV
jgi:hypothetical protein